MMLAGSALCAGCSSGREVVAVPQLRLLHTLDELAAVGRENNGCAMRRCHACTMLAPCRRALAPMLAWLVHRSKGVRKEDPKTKAPILYDLEDRINFAVFPGLQVSQSRLVLTSC